ncbi:hypothetical protein SAICODRAFT_33623 [Saitoella complicata NRRL Y-17804]|uniref:uncharacterized protein n=1 Tax=Saitoella complicata (strain BCRC 22490 / CBS 7301 / JCM 7358 / NBRC 10748 / NRRL Y-17804) TaxID=698492 RepID=UPI000867E78D|nr:uncharacterized protein SAICODRAFT_33623 [Saitoella complicata NRRL Y-17804]ODQ54966.1 hypothetical protein SAICODRAFT_33623 [Saitoella complicata NRRL Y-17804]
MLPRIRSLPLGRLPFTRVARRGQQVRNGSGGQLPFNEPSGNLFGEPRLKPGEKREKEDWENIWVYGYGGCFVIGGILYYNRPDTTIQTWAMEEAKKRMVEEGIKLDYPHTPVKY